MGADGENEEGGMKGDGSRGVTETERGMGGDDARATSWAGRGC